MGKPWEQLYARIQPSPIHGVGVFAIRDIPAGTLPFGGGEDDTVAIPAAEVAELPEPVRRLVNDMAPLQDGVYWCPPDFNEMGVGYYMNNSSTPNMATSDDGWNFHALRDIKAGEELTVDYETYSEQDS